MSTAGTPLVSVITPTWQRHDALFARCVPSVAAQDWGGPIEHVIVSDGPDPELRDLVKAEMRRRMTARIPGALIYDELPGHDPALHWGSPARKHGTSIAGGSLIAYNDDDDTLRPEHVRLLATALLDNPGTAWACSRMQSHQTGGDPVIGHGQLAFGNVGTPMLMHWADLLETANWDVSAPGEDWEIVSRWLGAGARYVRVDAETVDVWPSTFWGGKV